MRQNLFVFLAMTIREDERSAHRNQTVFRCHVGYCCFLAIVAAEAVVVIIDAPDLIFLNRNIVEIKSIGPKD